MLVALASGIRFIRLGRPKALVFDEVYYAKDACIYLNLGQAFCGLKQATEQSYVHPPTGKWLIAAGIKLFGYNWFGQRFMAAVFGVGLTVVVYLLAGRLFGRKWISAVAGLLVATDFLLIVQSRIAMLDIFLAFFVVLGFLFLAIDRQRVLAIRDHLSRDLPGLPPSRGLGYRSAAGAALGAALSVKWSGVFALVTAGLLSLSWSYGLFRLRCSSRSPRRPIAPGPALRSLAAAGVAFGLVPLTFYLASYLGFYIERTRADCAFTVSPGPPGRLVSAGRWGLDNGDCVNGFRGVAFSLADQHQRMLDYHLSLKASHPYQSKAWSWPLVLRPVAYYWQWRGSGAGASGGQRPVAHINAMGNPLTWYGSLVAGFYLVIRSVKRWRPETVVIAAWAAQYVPWLLVKRPLFLFYMTPVVPFMMLGLAAGLHALWERRGFRRRSAVVFLVLSAALVIFFFPVLTAIQIPYDAWSLRMWIRSFNCGGLRCGWI